MTEYDFRVQDEGTVIVLHPLNDAARSWIDEHLYAPHDEGAVTWWGGGVVVDTSRAQDVLDGIAADGLTVGT